MSHSSVIFLSSFLDEVALWFIFPCDFTFVVPNSGQNDVALIFSRELVFIVHPVNDFLPLFLPEFRRPSCGKISTTFASASLLVFTGAFTAHFSISSRPQVVMIS
jgi:hypothetical protein